MKKANQEEARLHNSRLVLSTIYHNAEISRVEVARRTQLTRTTVSEIVAEFMDAGLVMEAGLAPSTGGKPATLLRMVADARLMVGVDLAEREFCGALVNLRGQIVQRICLPVTNEDAAAALDQVYVLIEQLLQLADRPVIGIGIGAPGLMDPKTGSVREAVNLDWHDLPLANLLYQRFQLPIHLANDCQVAALGELIFGKGHTSSNLVVIKAGRGIGAGLVLNGQLFYGDSAGAGEIGHVRIIEQGELCRCGNRGCLETVASSQALLQRAKAIEWDKPQANIDLQMLAQAYQAGNVEVVSIVEEAGQALGSTIAHLVSALNIHRIRIAGSLSILGAGLLEPIQQSVQSGVLPALAQQTEVDLATLGDDIIILGAASLILKNELGLF